MAQANDTPTTIPVDFASQSAAPFRPTFRALTAQITNAHREFIERIRRLPPNEIDARLQADGEDIEHRAEVLRVHMKAMMDYVSEYIADTAGYTYALNINRKEIEAQFRDFISDIVGQLEIAAETVRQEGTWRAA